MDPNVLDCDPIERDEGLCVCKGGPSLDILKDVQKAYEGRIELINKIGGKNKTQKELDLLRSWVGDLIEQNGLLARAVEEMEAEVSSRVVFERRKNIEWDQKKNICDQVNALKVQNDSLKKDNHCKDREIRKLSNEVQHSEQTIALMKIETSFSRHVPMMDEAVMTEPVPLVNESGDLPPAQMLQECDGNQLDIKLKTSNESIRAIRKENVELREEVRTMSHLCAALYEQRLAAALRLQFKDDIIREMRRQLRQAKAKLESAKLMKGSVGDREDIEGLRRPRRLRRHDDHDGQDHYNHDHIGHDHDGHDHYGHGHDGHQWPNRSHDHSPDDSASANLE